MGTTIQAEGAAAQVRAMRGMTRNGMVRTDHETGLPVVSVETAGMGSCRCGDCVAEVRADGALVYEGCEQWQRSGWILQPGFPQPPRPYGSEVSQGDYEVALAEARRRLDEMWAFKALVEAEVAAQNARDDARLAEGRPFFAW